MSFVRLWVEGGTFQYFILANGLFHLAACLVESVTRGRYKLMPILFASLGSMILLGFLGTIFGVIATFDAVANASPAMKQTLLAAGIAVSMFTIAGSLIMSILGVWGMGIARVFSQKTVEKGE